MFFEHREFHLPKDVQAPDAYEDAMAADGDRGIAAVCDGVASTLFSGRWADLLAQGVIAEPPDIDDAAAWDAWLKRRREAWTASIDDSTLAWHQKPKLLDGAGSTLLWVQLSRSGPDDGIPRPFRMQAFAIGDCCLFHVRGGQILQSFPIEESRVFENDPQTLRSVFKRADAVSFQRLESDCHPGDYLVLATDAIAAWTMRQLEAGGEINWDAYWVASLDDWQRWLIELREANQIRYDDSTLLLLRVVGGETHASARPPAESGRDPVEGSALDKAGDTVRQSWKSLRSSLRKGLRELSESKWLRDDQ